MKGFTKSFQYGLAVVLAGMVVAMAALKWWCRDSSRGQEPGIASGAYEEAPASPSVTKTDDRDVSGPEPDEVQPAAERDELPAAMVLTGAAVSASAPTATLLPPSDPAAGLVPLAESPVAEKWLAEEGITADDIRVAQGRLRENGFPAHMIDDPGLVRQFLPRRNVASVNIHRLAIPGRARTGERIPFTVHGALPDPSFEFTRFEITRQDQQIRIRPVGNTSGNAVPGLEIPVALKGELDPLPPGTYHVEFPELGPVGSYELIVE